ncbi:hypothetical protein Harman_22540 [Haloarcula mannanilytica]|uniref:Uncharacterized protein n=1 Tax=Haloarcula mannanilytica TaxID=2509225 RepID=A0A4C2EQ70_9EURY|nr:hypothetical protein [Haloarcula mannanilytica]GCF14319.1 hypothetical protein Harman_22540 [Haloarcula mannanilytica]
MSEYRRDAGVALLCGVALIGYLGWSGAINALWSVPVAAIGVAVAVGVEALFVLDTPVGSLWERRGVRTGSAVALLVGAAGLAAVFGPSVVAAVCWGLVTYFVILAVTLRYR